MAMILSFYSPVQKYSPYADLPANVYRGQTHLHTTRSDGAETPETMAAAYKAAGYDWLVFTDHEMVTDDNSVEGLLTIAGAEEGQDDYMPYARPHIVCWPLVTPDNTGIAQMSINRSPVSIIAHPLTWTTLTDGYTGLTVALQLTGFTAVEMPGTSAVEAFYDALLNTGRRVWVAAGDDAHALPFSGRSTYLYAHSLTEAEIVASFQAGQFYVSTGPTLTITEDGTSLTIATPGAATIAFLGHDGALQSTPNAMSAEYVYLGTEGYVRAVVTRDSDGTKAWTIPVFL